MKKLMLFCLCVATFLCSGCVKDSFNIEIDDKDRISFSEIIGVNTEAFKPFGEIGQNKLIEKARPSIDKYEKIGFTVDKYDDGKIQGYKFSKTQLPIKIFNKDFPNEINGQYSDSIIVKRGSFKNKYKIKISLATNELFSVVHDASYDNENPYNTNSTNTAVIDKEDEPIFKKSSDETADESFGTAITSFFQVDMRMKVAGKVTRHNASKVLNENEYYWNLLDLGKDGFVELEYERINISTIIAGIIAFILLIGIFLYVRKLK